MGPLIFPLDHLSEAAPYLGDETLLGYLGEGQSESFEGFEDFDLLAFDWYDLHSERTETAKLLLYLSREKLNFFCESAAAEACVRAIVTPLGDGHTSEELAYRFFQRLLTGDMDRLDRYLGAVRNLQEVVSQLREAYQSQLSIQQNELMKLFTLVTAVFLPLTLLTGWYGMNFAHIPELTWRYGYPAAIVVSAVIVVLLLWRFKKKHWL